MSHTAELTSNRELLRGDYLLAAFSLKIGMMNWSGMDRRKKIPVFWRENLKRKDEVFEILGYHRKVKRETV